MHMFVDIKEFKSALMVENMLTPYKKRAGY